MTDGAIIKAGVNYENIVGSGIIPSNLFLVDLQATGGTITTVVEGEKTFRVHTFTANGDFVATNAGIVDICLVAGGAGGGAGRALNGGLGKGGGGGAGGLRLLTNQFIVAGTHPVVRGDGGNRGWPEVRGENGGNSSFYGITANGGGGGGTTTAADRPGVDGGSGGGAGGGEGGAAGGAATPAGQGNPGSPSTTDVAGGGGGAGTAGSGLNGGAGVVFMGLTYAQGGNSGNAIGVTFGTNGVHRGYGGGGGHGAPQNGRGGGFGGNGIVIIRYRIA